MRRILPGNSRNRGVTLVTLIIVITIFGVLVTVFSYMMTAKHRSEPLYVQSTQTYAVAQAGIEYGIRYATDNGYGNFPINNKAFGDGTFTLIYTPATETASSSLTSKGTVGVAERKIILKCFVGLVSGEGISLDPADDPDSEPA